MSVAFRLVNRVSRRLTVLLGVLASSAAVLLGAAGGASAATPSFTTHISPLNTGYLELDVAGASTQPGAPVIDWYANGGANQAWTFQSTGAANTYEIVNQNSGQCLTTNGVPGSQLYQWPCSANNPYQVWTTDLGAYYDFHGHAIRNPAFGLYVDVNGNSPWPGAAIDTWYWNGGYNQLFRSI